MLHDGLAAPGDAVVGVHASRRSNYPRRRGKTAPPQETEPPKKGDGLRMSNVGGKVHEFKVHDFCSTILTQVPEIRSLTPTTHREAAPFAFALHGAQKTGGKHSKQQTGRPPNRPQSSSRWAQARTPCPLPSLATSTSFLIFPGISGQQLFSHHLGVGVRILRHTRVVFPHQHVNMLS